MDDMVTMYVGVLVLELARVQEVALALARVWPLALARVRVLQLVQWVHEGMVET